MIHLNHPIKWMCYFSLKEDRYNSRENKTNGAFYRGDRKTVITFAHWVGF